MTAPRRPQRPAAERTTEDRLFERYGAAVVRLSDICDQYLGNGEYQARIRANRNGLPFPAFRLDPSSHRSPWMVHIRDLAAFVDQRSDESRASWLKSQV